VYLDLAKAWPSAHRLGSGTVALATRPTRLVQRLRYGLYLMLRAIRAPMHPARGRHDSLRLDLLGHVPILPIVACAPRRALATATGGYPRRD